VSILGQATTARTGLQSPPFLLGTACATALLLECRIPGELRLSGKTSRGRSRLAEMIREMKPEHARFDINICAR
jgi:hypothetical protein